MQFLTYLKDGFVKKYALDRPAVTIGRASGCDIVLDDEAVSKKHCRVESFPGYIRVVDLKSRNGTFVDKAPIREAKLSVNSSFGVGGTEFYLQEGDGKEFRVSPELSAIFDRLSLAKRRQTAGERETRDSDSKYDRLILDFAEKAIVTASFDEFLAAVRNGCALLIRSGSLFFRCEDRTLALFDHLDLSGSGKLTELWEHASGETGSLAVAGRPCAYRFIPSAGCPRDGGALYVREGKPLPEADPFIEFLKKLMHLFDFQRNLIAEIRLAPRQEPPVFARDGLALIGQSPAMRKISDMARRIAPKGSFVLILGESGTGKELVARMIHDLSGRGRYVAINCAAIPEPLLESELFGHEAGAFTDARRKKAGKLEEASGGTLVLDEVGDMPPAIQAKLLRAIQERAVTRLGGSALIPVDLRIIALTNQDLYRLVDEKAFRQDLFFRLRVHELKIPPLRERREDIPALLVHFSQVYAEKNQVVPRGFSEAVHECFQDYPWPGNVRELENEVARIMEIIEDGELIGLHHVLPSIASACRAEERRPETPEPETLKEKLEATEREEIVRLLAGNQGNKLRTARALQMSYQGFLKKLKRLHIGS